MWGSWGLSWRTAASEERWVPLSGFWNIYLGTCPVCSGGSFLLLECSRGTFRNVLLINSLFVYCEMRHAYKTYYQMQTCRSEWEHRHLVRGCAVCASEAPALGVLYFNCVCVCMFMWGVCARECGCLWKPEVGIGPLELELQAGLGAGHWVWALWKSSKHS